MTHIFDHVWAEFDHLGSIEGHLIVNRGHSEISMGYHCTKGPEKAFQTFSFDTDSIFDELISCGYLVDFDFLPNDS